MKPLQFARVELAAAVGRGVRQCVFLDSRLAVDDVLRNSSSLLGLDVFELEREGRAAHSWLEDTSGQLGLEATEQALSPSGFNRMKATLFIWLGGAKLRTADAVLASLSFIASFPKGSGVVFDYARHRYASYSGEGVSASGTALDALASKVNNSDGDVKFVIEPQALTALLNGLGFSRVVDLARGDLQVPGHRLVSAVL